jgi:hypothetical protein
VKFPKAKLNNFVNWNELSSNVLIYLAAKTNNLKIVNNMYGLSYKVNNLIQDYIKKHNNEPNTLILGEEELQVFDLDLSNAQNFRIKQDEDGDFIARREFCGLRILEVKEKSYIGVCGAVLEYDEESEVPF